MSLLVLAVAHAKMSRARCAKPCAVVGRRDHCSNVCRSSAVNTMGGVGRPVRIDVLRVYMKNVVEHYFVLSPLTQDTSTRRRQRAIGKRRHTTSDAVRDRPRLSGPAVGTTDACLVIVDAGTSTALCGSSSAGGGAGALPDR